MTTVLAYYDCPSCGAQVEAPEELVSTKCAFCDSAIVKSEVHESADIDVLLPFIVEKKKAGLLLQRFLSGQFFAPKSVRERTQPDLLKGVFVPFWVYQAEAKSQYSARVGIYWYETVKYTVVENGKRVTKTKRERRTEWHNLSGSHVQEYCDHLVCASKGIEESETNAIEPFDMGKALAFTPELLAGWLAERPTRSLEEAAPLVHKELMEHEGNQIQRFLPGDTHSNVRYSTSVDVRKVQSALLPIWVATYNYKKQVVRLLVNGQTGKVSGSVPTDWKKVSIFVLVCVVVLVIVIFILGNS